MVTPNERDRRDVDYTTFFNTWFIAEIYLFHIGNLNRFYDEVYHFGGNNQQALNFQSFGT